MHLKIEILQLIPNQISEISLNMILWLIQILKICFVKNVMNMIQEIKKQKDQFEDKENNVDSFLGK